MKFQIPSTITKITTMSDHCLRLQVDSQELSKADKAQVFNLHELLGWFVFSEAELKEEDLINLPELKPEFDEISPSKRLRNRLFVYYKNTHTDTNNFDNWYKKEIERIGQHYLDKI